MSAQGALSTPVRKLVDGVLPVIFRVMKSGEVIALFPTLPARLNGLELTSYLHVGQHGASSWKWYYTRSHRPAKPEEYAALLAELRGIYEDTNDDPVRLEVFRSVSKEMQRMFRDNLDRAKATP
jgi:hypothetical protein